MDETENQTKKESAPSETVREIVCAGWDGRSEPIYRYRDELDLPEWQQARVFPPQNMLPVKSVNVRAAQ